MLIRATRDDINSDLQQMTMTAIHVEQKHHVTYVTLDRLIKVTATIAGLQRLRLVNNYDCCTSVTTQWTPRVVRSHSLRRPTSAAHLLWSRDFNAIHPTQCTQDSSRSLSLYDDRVRSRFFAATSSNSFFWLRSDCLPVNDVRRRLSICSLVDLRVGKDWRTVC